MVIFSMILWFYRWFVQSVLNSEFEAIKMKRERNCENWSNMSKLLPLLKMTMWPVQISMTLLFHIRMRLFAFLTGHCTADYYRWLQQAYWNLFELRTGFPCVRGCSLVLVTCFNIELFIWSICVGCGPLHNWSYSQIYTIQPNEFNMKHKIGPP